MVSGLFSALRFFKVRVTGVTAGRRAVASMSALVTVRNMRLRLLLAWHVVRFPRLCADAGTCSQEAFMVPNPVRLPTRRLGGPLAPTLRVGRFNARSASAWHMTVAKPTYRE